MRNWSKARVKNVAKVETKGRSPRLAIPQAAETIFCSAINISKNLSSCSFLKYSEYVELETSASKTTIVGCAGKILLSAFPYAFLVATAEPFSYFGSSILDTSCLLLDNAGGLVSSPLIFLSSVPSSDN